MPVFKRGGRLVHKTKSGAVVPVHKKKKKKGKK